MATAIGDHIRWYRETWVPHRVFELESELVPGDSAFSHHAERVAAAIFDRTGLAPSEYKRLNAGGKLVWLEKACGKQEPEEIKTPQQGDQEPKAYLLGWREILDALGLKSDQKDRVARLSSEYEGPIIVPGQGAQPKVEKTKLLAWWNRLEITWEDQLNQKRGGALEGASQHDYGRMGRVAPEIKGSVRKRRKAE